MGKPDFKLLKVVKFLEWNFPKSDLYVSSLKGLRDLSYSFQNVGCWSGKSNSCV